LPEWSAIASPAPADRVKFSTDEYGHLGLGYHLDASQIPQPANALPLASGITVRREVVKQQERVRFPAAKLRRHIKHGGGFGFDTGQTSQDLDRKP
jgi:hypothetical protein